MRTTRFVQVDQPYQLRLVDEPCPGPEPGEVLLAARRTLISPGSELRRYRRYEGYDAFQYPVTDLGYSFSGEVVEVGEGLTGIAPGDRYCAVKRHATYVTVKPDAQEVRTAVRLPDGVSDEEGTFGPFMRSTLNWLRQCDVQVTDSVAILGHGLVGALMNMAVQLHHPRRVYVTDAFPLRLDIAKELGADEAINVTEVDPVKAVREANRKPVDVVIDTVGGSHVESVEQAVALAGSHGRVIYIGIHTAPLSIPTHAIGSSLILGANRGYDHDIGIMKRGLELMAAGKLPVGKLITHRLSYERAAEAFALLDQRPQEALAVILEWPG